jgi:hypothetical protein
VRAERLKERSKPDPPVDDAGEATMADLLGAISGELVDPRTHGNPKPIEPERETRDPNDPKTRSSMGVFRWRLDSRWPEVNFRRAKELRRNPGAEPRRPVA